MSEKLKITSTPNQPIERETNTEETLIIPSKMESIYVRAQINRILKDETGLFITSVALTPVASRKSGEEEN